MSVSAHGRTVSLPKTPPNPLRESTNFTSHFNAIWVVQLARPKIFRFSFPPNPAPSSRHPASSKRGVRVVTIRGVRGAVDAIGVARARHCRAVSSFVLGCERSIRAGRAALLRTAKACGSGTRGWCQAGGGCFSYRTGFVAVNPAATEARGIRLRGERAISRQTIAQGRPDALRWTCMLVCALLCAHLHTGPRVQRAPGLPCALVVSRDTSGCISSGRVSPASVEVCPGLSRLFEVDLW